MKTMSAVYGYGLSACFVTLVIKYADDLFLYVSVLPVVKGRGRTLGRLVVFPENLVIDTAVETGLL